MPPYVVLHDKHLHALAAARPSTMAAMAKVDGMGPRRLEMYGDDLLSARLCQRVLEVLPTLLRPGGGLAMKILEGEDTPHVMNKARRLFNNVAGFKPKSSRDVSRETFIVAKGFRPPAPKTEPRRDPGTPPQSNPPGSV